MRNSEDQQKICNFLKTHVMYSKLSSLLHTLQLLKYVSASLGFSPFLPLGCSYWKFV